MAEVTREMVYRELLKLNDAMELLTRQCRLLSIESNRCSWEAQLGGQRIDRARREFEAQIAARRGQQAYQMGIAQ